MVKHGSDRTKRNWEEKNDLRFYSNAIVTKRMSIYYNTFIVFCLS